MRCAIYRRVSTDMQVEDGVSLDTQYERLKSFAHSQGWKIVDNYVDEGYSAKNLDRPAVQRLIEDIKEKKFDVLLIYKLDRLVRRVKDLHDILQIMDQHNVKFKSATEVFDTTTAMGKLFITIVGAMAEWERETIAERVYDNMLHRAEQGKRNGGMAPFGYDYNDKGQLIINEDEAKWVRFIYMKYRTMGSQNIAKELNKNGIKTKKGYLFSDFAVRFILKNPIYSGQTRWNWRSPVKGQAYTGEEIIVAIDQDNFVPIVTVDEFEETQNIIEKRSKVAFRSDNHYPFSGIAKCEKCGHSFTGAFKKRKNGEVYRYYKCAGRFKYGICDEQVIAEESMEKALFEFIDLANIEIDLETDEMMPGQKKEELEALLNKLQMKAARIKELYIEGEYSRTEYDQRMKKIKKEEKQLLDQLSKIDEEVTEEEIKEILYNIKSEWNNLSHEAKKHALSTIFENLTIELIEPTRIGGRGGSTRPVVKIKEYTFAN